jgi:hypothetical protein
MPLLTRTFTDRPPFRVFDVKLGERRAAEKVAEITLAPVPAPRTRRATDAVAS